MKFKTKITRISTKHIPIGEMWSERHLLSVSQIFWSVISEKKGSFPVSLKNVKLSTEKLMHIKQLLVTSKLTQRAFNPQKYHGDSMGLCKFFWSFSYNFMHSFWYLFVNNVVFQSNHFCKTYNKTKCYEKSQIFNLW